ncbi:hypothetical protein BJX68DRAFT_10796 [Aspergillus pseudodeflectus]|uniref:BZIP domain-containing protein n=1 Tax=Aspergillus pseudodeflectus TaxID=176178 RepID=A0ABR4LC73_9EURO
MSQIPPVLAQSPTDAHPREDRGSLERKRRHTGDENLPDMERRGSVRSRPSSWHPSAPVEPPLSSSQHRSIGVSSILNHPPADGLVTRTGSVDSGREGLGGEQYQQQRLSSDSPSHSRYPSSSTVHLPSPSMHPANHPSALSPGMRTRHQSIAPVSPSSHFVGATGYFPPKPGPGQSPLAQQLPGLQTVAPSLPLSIDTAPGQLLPGSVHHHQVSVHSASTFIGHRASTNQTPTPSSKETSPTTPVSVFSQLGRSSPAIAAASAPQSTPLYPQYAQLDPITRLPIMDSPWRSGEETSGLSGPQPETLPRRNIPCFKDEKSGSSIQAEKRKANSDASRRFRNRKRNEMQMEQKITSQQDEIRKQAETIQKQDEELHVLRKQRDFYRGERDFYREQLNRFVPADQLPARGTSPEPLCLTSDPTTSGRESSSWASPDIPVKLEGPPSGSTTHQNTSGLHAPASNVSSISASRAGGSWSAIPTSSAYPIKAERVTPDERQARPMPPTPSSWSRTT